MVLPSKLGFDIFPGPSHQSNYAKEASSLRLLSNLRKEGNNVGLDHTWLQESPQNLLEGANDVVFVLLL
jgi:hypothetical protein